jgi:hypothetical protein
LWSELVPLSENALPNINILAKLREVNTAIRTVVKS